MSEWIISGCWADNWNRLGSLWRVYLGQVMLRFFWVMSYCSPLLGTKTHRSQCNLNLLWRRNLLSLEGNYTAHKVVVCPFQNKTISNHDFQFENSSLLLLVSNNQPPKFRFLSCDQVAFKAIGQTCSSYQPPEGALLWKIDNFQLFYTSSGMIIIVTPLQTLSFSFLFNFFTFIFKLQCCYSCLESVAFL